MAAANDKMAAAVTDGTEGLASVKRAGNELSAAATQTKEDLGQTGSALIMQGGDLAGTIGAIFGTANRNAAQGVKTAEDAAKQRTSIEARQKEREASQAATMADAEKAMKELSQAVLGVITPIVDILTPVIKFMALAIDGLVAIINKFKYPLEVALAAAVAAYAYKNKEAVANSLKNAGASAVNYVAGAGKGSKGRGIMSSVAGAMLTRDGSSPERALYVIMTGGAGGMGDILENNNKKTVKMSEAGEKRRAAREAVVSRGRAMQTLSKGGNILKSGLTRFGGGIGGVVGGMALGYGADLAKEKGMNKTAAGLDIASNAASWAGTGALVGSVIPVLGTAVGAAVGGIAGGIYGLAQNWDALFKEQKDEKTKLPDAGQSTDEQIIGLLKKHAEEAEKSRILQERSVRHLDDINSSTDNSRPTRF
jgi:hypothetical protein